MPVISSEVPGADDRLFKSEANSGMSVLVGKHSGRHPTQTLSDGVGGLDQPVVCLSVCLSGFSVGDRRGGGSCSVIGGRGGGQRTVLWNYG